MPTQKIKIKATGEVVEKKKYICYGEYMKSRNDRDIHYITSRRVAELFNVNPLLCYFVDRENTNPLRGVKKEGLIGLHPEYDGNYYLKDEIEDHKLCKECQHEALNGHSQACSKYEIEIIK